MQSRIPVVVWVSTFAAGGTERQMIRLMGGLDPRVYEVYGACFLATGAWTEEARRLATVVEFPLNGFRTPESRRSILEFARWCRQKRIAAVVTSDWYTNVFGLLGAALGRVPVRIGGRREINTDKNTAKLLLQRAAYGLAHRVVANSEAAARRLEREHVSSRRIRVVHNGIELPALPAMRRSGMVRRAITVANLRAEKGHDVLLDAIASRPELKSVTFDIVGDGPCRAALEARARDLGIADRVRFLGHREDVPALLAGSDLFVLPSRTEAFPNSVMEAMAAGLPVVATRTGGIVELVAEGTTGRLVPVGDSAALADAIARVMASPETAARFGAAGRARIGAEYSVESMVRGFSDLIQSELERRRVGAGSSPAIPASAKTS